MIRETSAPRVGGDSALVLPLVRRLKSTNLTPAWLSGGILVGGCVIGVVLRVLGLGTQSLWLDEAFSVYVAAHPFHDILSIVTTSDAHPPLYYLLLHLWLLAGTSPAVMRALSALASIAALCPMYLLSRRLASPFVAALATAFLGLSAFQIWYAQEARMYALVSLATLVALYGLVRAVQVGGGGAWVLFVIAMLAALYLDYSAVYVLFAVLIWFALYVPRHTRIWRSGLLSCVALAAGYLPWLVAVWQQARVLSGLTAWITGANSAGLDAIVVDFFLNRTNLSQADVGALAGALDLACIALVALALWVPRKADGYPLIALWFAVPALISGTSQIMGHPVLISRTMLVAQPALLLLLAMTVERTLTSGREGILATVQYTSLVAAMTVFVAANVLAARVPLVSTVKEDWRGAANLVAADYRSGDLIVFDSYFSQMPFDLAFYPRLGAQRPVSTIEGGYHTQESLLYVDPNTTSPAIGRGRPLSGYTRVWLVLSHTGVAPEQVSPPDLAQRYHIAREWHYVGVTVRLYDVPGT